ncbi:hypothetical protein QFC19_001796 [Naganishia cerealis]|uniref:Uncharacterized protein n=1 Tax=Naganishia cerealis TaxID=610337 RepID=A0ACC2WEC2_9TREE|nr:hypothetical protein QFC19_001796 [Naganishia cerealis]
MFHDALLIGAFAAYIDEFYDVPHIVRPGQTISAISTSRRLGGKGANQAKAAACAGATVLLDGAVGSGAEGREVVDELCAAVQGVKDAGVPTPTPATDEGGRILSDRIRKWDDGPTGKAMIQRAQDGENSIIILAGANFSHPTKPYSPLLPRGTTHLLLANEIPFPETIAYLRASSPSPSSGGMSASTITTIYNPSPMPSSTQLLDFPWSLVTWLIVNEGELGDIARAVLSPSNTEKHVQQAVEYLTSGDKEKDEARNVEASTTVARALHTALPRLSSLDNEPTEGAGGAVNIICTLGSSGVLYVRSLPTTTATATASVSAKRIAAAKLLRPIRDTTGAGDCFMGFLAAGLMRLEERVGGGGDANDQADGVKEEEEEAFDDVIRRCLTVRSSPRLTSLQ